MKRPKLVYIISDIDKALAFEWVALGLVGKFDLFFVLIGKQGSRFSEFLKKNSIRYYQIEETHFPKTLGTWFRLFWILWKENPCIVHTHLWRATLLGLSASWLMRIRKRIYTRHHAMIHYLEFPSGRKWDMLCNRIATHIVAISENIKDILVTKDKADINKVHLIHHGFDFDYFQSVETERIDAIRTKYQLTGKEYPVIGVISRYIEWKGVQYIIPAFSKLLKQSPNAHLVLANANGPYQFEIKKLLQALPTGSYSEIVFEHDAAALFWLFDVYVHAPIDAQSEAFGQTYIEALACGVPSVFTLSGVAREFIVHEKNALVVPFCDSNAIASAIERILTDDALRLTLIENGKKSAAQFPLEKMVNQLSELYAR